MESRQNQHRSQRQQRESMLDRSFEDSQVGDEGQNHAPGNGRDQSPFEEQDPRTRMPLQQRQNHHQIQRCRKSSHRTEVGIPGLPLSMRHLNFPHPIPPVIGHQLHETESPAGEGQFASQFLTHQFESAVAVMKRRSSHQTDRPVVEEGGDSFGETISTLVTPADDHIGSLLQHTEKPIQFLR